MPDEQPQIEQPAVHEPATLAYDQIDADADWPDESEEPDELPRRPRRRLLTPLPLGLLGALLIAAGFIAGVQVQKGEETSPASSGATGSTLASRLGALRGAGTSTRGSGSSKAAGGGFPGAGAGGARPTIGTVAYLAGNTLYVTNAEGNTIKVDTSPATSVTKTVTAQVNGVHPGETVTITGTTGASGAVSAESISVGSSAGGLSALFGGSAKSSGAGGAQALFGSG